MRTALAVSTYLGFIINSTLSYYGFRVCHSKVVYIFLIYLLFGILIIIIKMNIQGAAAYNYNHKLIKLKLKYS